MGMPIRVCFVCLGNICRSPTAEGVMLHTLAREGLADRFVIDSAGTGGHHAGERPDPRSLRAAKARAISLPSRARKFTQEDFARFDYVLAMDAQNQSDLLRLAPDPLSRSKVRLFLSFLGDTAAVDEVPDPYYGGEQGFEQVLDLCEQGCLAFIERLRADGQI